MSGRLARSYKAHQPLGRGLHCASGNNLASDGRWVDVCLCQRNDRLRLAFVPCTNYINGKEEGACVVWALPCNYFFALTRSRCIWMMYCDVKFSRDDPKLTGVGLLDISSVDIWPWRGSPAQPP
jgi:hypothetical protein